MSLYDSLTTESGTSVRLGRLATVGLGMLSTAFFGSLSATFATAWNAFLVRPIRGLATFAGRFVETAISVPTAVVNGGWQSAESFATAFGVFAFAVSVVFVVVLAYGVRKGWSLHGG